MLSKKKKGFAKKLANIMTEFMQKTENSYLWPSRFESNPQSYGNKKHATLPMLPIVPVLPLTLLAAVADGVTFADFNLPLVIHLLKLLTLCLCIPPFFGHVHTQSKELKSLILSENQACNKFKCFRVIPRNRRLLM